MSAILHHLCTVLGMAVLAWAYQSAGYWIVSASLASIGLFWLLAERRRWSWFAPIGLLAGVSASAGGLWLDLAPLGMILGAVCCIAAWDLSRFRTRLSLADPEDNPHLLERRHLAGLALFALVALLSSAGATMARIPLDFGQAVILVVVGVFGITQLVRWLRERR
jgi:hypothetical protein